MALELSEDEEVAKVAIQLQELDSTGRIFARVIRDTIDQLYDGQRTGRYKWDQLYKTEKTHCGTLVEINLQRQFDFNDGKTLDFEIAGIEVDCKYSQRLGGWMIPPEALGHVCMVVWAEDSFHPKWSLGLVRITTERLNSGGNRDSKATLNSTGRDAILWIWKDAELPPNVLLQLPQDVVSRIMAAGSGVRRVNTLFRLAQGMRIGRAVVATVAQQDDYMKRVRANGGARTTLKPEGIIILGQYRAHIMIAEALGLPVPNQGESVSARIIPANSFGTGVVSISGSLWKLALPVDPITAAPDLPKV
jgi:Restriction endonuclease NaeI